MSNIYLTREEIEHPYADLKTMLEDKRRKAEQMSKTVFHHITQSPEVLAEKLVYRSFIRRKELRGNGLFLEWKSIKIKCYKSKVIPGVHYKNSTEAFAATVAKLKEVKR